MLKRFRLRITSLLTLLAIAASAFSAMPVKAGSVPSGPNAQITDSGLGDYSDAELPDLQVIGSTVYAAWSDDRDNQRGAVYFSKSTDSGATWGANVLVSRLSGANLDDWIDDPAIAVLPNGTIVITWYRFYREDSNRTNDVRVGISTDGGQTFLVGTLITGTPDDPDADVANDLSGAQIAVDPVTNRLYVLIHTRAGGNDGYDIVLRGFDADLNVVVPRIVVNDQQRSGRDLDDLVYGGPHMSLAVNNGVVCVAWEDTRARFSIYGTCSRDGGATFGPNVAVSPADSGLPRIALAPDGGLYATYTTTDDRPRTIVLRRSADNGATWSTPRQVVSLDSGFQLNSWDLAVDANGQIVLPWSSQGFGSGGSGDTILATSIDRGENFASTVLNDLQGEYPTVDSQFDVTVAVGGSGTATRAFVAWSDDRNVQDQIWFARANLDGIAPTAPSDLQATSSDTSILLTWGASTDAFGVQGYRVYRATTSGGTFAPISPVLIQNTTYRDVGLGPTPYVYKVAAIDGTGNVGPLSNEASATAQAGSGLPLRGTLAYESGDNLTLRDLPDLGQPRAIGQGRVPDFSRDGSRLFYLDDAGIQSRPVGGGAPQLFLRSDDMVDFALAADEQHLGALIVRQAPGPIGFPVCTVTEPYFGTESGFTYTDDNALATGIGVSADHRWLVFRYLGFCNAAAYGTVSPGNFCVVDTTTNQRACIEGANYRDAEFAPSGNWLAFAADISGHSEIWKAQIQSDGTLTNYTQLTRGPANQPASNPSWSSDGSWIVFQRGASADDTAVQNLHAVRNDGAAVRNLNIVGTAPAWFGGGSGPGGNDYPYHMYLPLTRR